MTPVKLVQEEESDEAVELRVSQTQLLREVAHLRELVEERLTALEQRVDARFKAQDLRFLLYIGGALGVMRLDLPSPITAVAVGLLVGKGLLGVFTARFF